jgi:hypothetical protein
MFKASSLVYHVDKLTVPLLVHVADNDEDVIWEAQVPGFRILECWRRTKRCLPPF